MSTPVAITAYSLDDLEVVLNTHISRENREAALMALLTDSWKRGWDDATAEGLKVLQRAGAVATKPMLGWPADQQ